MVLSLFRIVTGLLLFQYGVAKIFKFPVLPYFANIAAADHWPRAPSNWCSARC